jgi:hypothetical protein
MLILFDDSIGADAATLVRDSRFVACLDNLLIAHRKGVHIISGSSGTIRTLLTAFGTRPEFAGVLRSIAAHTYTRAALIAEVTDYIVVQAHDTPSVTRETRAGRSVYYVPFTYFIRFSSITASRLVAEDSEDVALYSKAIAAYIHYKARALRGLTYQVQGLGGGGSSTADQFHDRAQEGPTLAIVDSDRKHPQGALGSTALSIERTARSIKDTTVSYAEILKCHELENIIPSSLVMDCLESQDSAAFAQCLRDICQHMMDGTEGTRYLDLKNGIRGWDCLSREPVEARHYNATNAQKLPLANLCLVPKCQDRDSCTCIYVHGFGGGILGRVATKVSSISPQKAAEYFFSASSATRDLWLELAQRLFSWTCAARQLRA